MNPRTLDLILIISASFFVLADIILALCLRFVLPRYVIDVNWYYVGDYALPFPVAAAKCPCLYGVFPNGTNSDIHFGEIPTERPIEIEKKLTRHKWLVSVHTVDNFKTNFRCPGIIIFEDKFLSSINCPVSIDALNKIQVRSNSPYYNKFGRLHHVKQLRIRSDHLFEMTVSPTFSKENVPKPSPELTFSPVKGTYAAAVSWKKMAENEPFKEITWTTKNAPANLSKTVCPTYSKNQILRIVVTNCNEVVNLRWSDFRLCDYHKMYRLKKTLYVLPKCEV